MLKLLFVPARICRTEKLMKEMKPSIPTFSRDNNIPYPYLYLYGGDAGIDYVPPLSGHR